MRSYISIICLANGYDCPIAVWWEVKMSKISCLTLFNSEVYIRLICWYKKKKTIAMFSSVYETSLIQALCPFKAEAIEN